MGSQLSDCMQDSNELEELKNSHSINLERIAFLEDQNEELSLRFTSLQNDHFHDIVDKVNLERKIESMQTQMDQQQASEETKQQQETTHLEDLVALKLQNDASETKANTLLQLNKTLFLQKEESDQKAATLLQLNKTLLEKIKENQMQIAAVNHRIAAMEHDVSDENNNKKRTNKQQQKPTPRVAQML